MAVPSARNSGFDKTYRDDKGAIFVKMFRLFDYFVSRAEFIL